jgi:putative toxin-antitoxin system antitoxin component (TIGR02293 family)
MIKAPDIAAVMGGKSVMKGTIRTFSDLDREIGRGIRREALDRVLSAVIGEGPATAKFRNLVIPRATYQRKQILDSPFSDRVERLARVFAMAKSIWGDAERARHFLNTPHPELEGRTPIETALTEIGARRVEAVMERGVHGLPA